MSVYVERGAAVDQAHRQLEQRRVALLYPQLPEFETLRTRLDGMRRAWRAWADAWAREFNALCKAHGFLPSASHQQRTIFDEVVKPLTQEAGTTAYFVVDALRFEMGEELYRQMESTPATTALLKPRLAELPTVTEVGMNVLAPVEKNGRLHISMASDMGAVQGFQTGEFRVSDPETRKRAMHDRVGGGTCPWLTLEEVVNRDSTSLKRSVAQARLIVVHSQEIDNAGEKGSDPPCSTTSCRSYAPLGVCCETRACVGSSSPAITASSCWTTAPRPLKRTVVASIRNEGMSSRRWRRITRERSGSR